MRQRFKCEPPETKGVIFIARSNGKIVGSAVIESSTGEPFSLEGRYKFDENKTPYIFIRSHIVQGSRWISVLPLVSHRVLYELATVSLDFGKRYLLIEAKPYSINRMQDLGIICKKIPNCKLQIENIRKLVGKEGMRYFEEYPPPSLFMCEFTQIIRALGLNF